MKKFLSLVMALVMTMSLVTIGAGATEYKDLTDKNEIQYEEAVAVLNKLGIISGYEDGSFRPTGALTRGAAAKIIVSLMIGTEAANALTVNTAPYSDVPVTNTFAAVISYCKTAGYINGYTDGTFRPAAALTGYAFTKMLLGALGYDGKQEGFTGDGWIMNVSKLGNVAGLFNDFTTAFKGNDGVDRQSACLLALNTLKATMVEYSGGTNITTSTGDATTTVNTNKVRSYVTSNNTNIHKNIYTGDASGTGNNYRTLEFGEEHFQDLKLLTQEGNYVMDDYGNPANEWSFKNVKIGTYPIAPDYTFTAGASGDTAVDKVKDMGLKDLKFDTSITEITVNGREVTSYTDSNGVTHNMTTGATTVVANAELLNSLVKNGSLVKVYISKTDANIISHIAVTESQIMQINRVTTKDVTLKKVEDNALTNTVNTVKDDDAVYQDLKDLKSDDYVIVYPLATSRTGSFTYDVDAVFIPTTSEGKISKVSTNKSGGITGVTVGDTDYKMSKHWTAEDGQSSLTTNSVSTTLTSTAYLDAYGYAIYVANVKATTDYMLFDEFYSNSVDGRNHYFATGWDMKGNEVSLDMGTNSSVMSGKTSGNVYAYKLALSNTKADYEWDNAMTASHVSTDNTTNQPLNADSTSIVGNNTNSWNAGSGPIDNNGMTRYFTSGVKFIFITMAGDGTVDTITVKDGAQKLSSGITYQYVYNNDDNGSSPAVWTPKITAVVVQSDKDVEVSQNIMYVEKIDGSTTNSEGKTVSIFTGYANGEKIEKATANKLISQDTFYTYKVDDATGIYTVNAYTNSADKATSVVAGAYVQQGNIQSKAYINSGNLVLATGDTLATNLNLTGATVFDLRTGGTLSSVKDMAEYVMTPGNTVFKISLIYNDSTSASSQGRVQYVFITAAGLADALGTATTKYTVSSGTTGDDALLFSLSADGPWSASVSAPSATTTYVKAADGNISVSGLTITTPATALSAVAGKAGVYSFSMPGSNLAITAATVDGYKATGIYFDGTNLLIAGAVVGGGGVPSGTDLAKLAETLLEAEGYTVSAISSAGDITFSKDGFTDTVANGNIDAAAISIKVNGTTQLVATGTKVSDICTNVSDDAASFAKLVDGTFEAGDAVVTADHDYDAASDEYVAFTAGGHSVAGFNAVSKADGVVIQTGDKVKVGSTITTELTATAAIVVTDPAKSNAAKISSATVADTIVFSGDATKVATNSGGALTFTNNAGDTIVAEGDTITFTHNAKPAAATAYTSAVIIYAAAHD